MPDHLRCAAHSINIICSFDFTKQIANCTDEAAIQFNRDYKALISKSN